MFKKILLLDSDVIIDFLRGQQKVKSLFYDIEQGRMEAAFSTITETELFAGKSCNSLEEQQKIDALLGLMKRLSLDKNAARKAGELKRRYELGLADAVIAATAITNSIKIISTKNKKHFAKVKEVTIEEPY
ncbi:MAG TPA: type II toxin-antitoxin system VapC family toxin [Candidatus Nanoarchaeia archaeon]|nr:type II toxin-antitoxin system VapC family toxin [Candidatus Nanoarchaeia archaeon]